ncbi:MAG: MFS transporter [Petrimonas sp.]|nr:MFS transporter [Petrimonas sp.]
MSKGKNSFITFTILSLSLVTMSYTVASVIISDLAKAFPALSKLTLDVYSSMPNVMIVLFALLFAFLAKRISKKSIAIAGSLLFLLGGVAPAIFPYVSVLMISRAVLGAGLGLLTPLTTSLVSDFFSGDKRARLMGYTSAFANIGTLFISYLAGIWCVISWQNTFWVYAILGVPIVISSIFFMPKYTAFVSKDTVAAENKKHAFNRNLIKPVVHVSLFMGLMYSYIVNISLLITEKNMGNSELAGILLMMLSIAGLAGGFIFSKVRKIAGKYQYSINYFLCGISMLASALTKNTIIMIAGSVLIGIGIAIAIPSSLVEISRTCNTSETQTGMGIMVASYNIAMFVIPVILSYILSLFSIIKAEQIMLVSAGLLLGCMMISFFLAKREKNIATSSETALL